VKWQRGAGAIAGLLDASVIQFENQPAIEEALFAWKDSVADYGDCTQCRTAG